MRQRHVSERELATASSKSGVRPGDQGLRVGNANGPTARRGGVAQQWRLLLGIGISAFFLYFVAQQVNNWPEIGRSLSTANYWYVLPALGVYFFGVWLRAIRWRYLLQPIKTIGVTRLFRVVVIGYMANDVLPARLGEAVRAYILGEREDLSKSATLATILVERLFDGIIMLLFMALVGLIFPFDEGLQQIFRITGAIFVAALVGFIIVACSKRLALRLLRLLLRPLPVGIRERIADFADRFLDGLDVLRSPALVFATLALTAGAWLAEATMYFLISLGFGLPLGFPAYLLTTAVANLGTMVPSAPGYIGTFEALATRSLALFGADPNVALSYVIVLHVALLVPVTLLGFVYLWQSGLTLSGVQRQLDQSRDDIRHRDSPGES